MRGRPGALAACAPILSRCLHGGARRRRRRPSRRATGRRGSPVASTRVPVGSAALRIGSAGFGVCAVPVGDGVPSLRCYDDFRRRRSTRGFTIVPEDGQDDAGDDRGWQRVRTSPRYHDHLRLSRDRPGGRARSGRPARRRGPGDPAGMEPVPRPGAGASPGGRPRAGDPQRPRLLGRPDHPRRSRRPRLDRPGDPPRIGRRPEALRRLAGGGRRNVPGGPSRRAFRPGRRVGSPLLPWPEACSSWPSTRWPSGRSSDLRREHAARRPPRQPDGRARRAARASWTSLGWPWPWIPATPTSRAGVAARPSPPVRCWPRPTSTTTTAGRIPTNRPARARSTGQPGASHSTRSVTPGRSCWNASGTSARIESRYRPGVSSHRRHRSDPPEAMPIVRPRSSAIVPACAVTGRSSADDEVPWQGHADTNRRRSRSAIPQSASEWISGAAQAGCAPIRQGRDCHRVIASSTGVRCWRRRSRGRGGGRRAGRGHRGRGPTTSSSAGSSGARASRGR